MKAIAQDVYGSADVLRLCEVDQPSVGEDQVLVQVRAAGVDPGVWVCMTGRPYGARVAFGLRRPRVAVRGRALAGVVSAIGSGVRRFQPGDEVYGTGAGGTFAEYATASCEKLAPKPPSLSFEQAAAVPISGVTALECVRDGGRVRAGQRVMVVGAGGGIGSFAVQIAKAFGARVTGVCSTGKAELVRSLGADEVIDYTREEIDRDGPRHDVVIDIAGCRPLSLLRRALTPRGTLVLAGGGHDAGGLLGGYTRQLRAPLVSMFTSQRLRGLASRERAQELEELGRLIESGAVTPVVDRTYRLADAPDAIRHLAEGHPTGKIVIAMGSGAGRTPGD
ncbi:NAD(P)-dependent alcohol dehydrogenase [Streptosporangium lutulentum]|uniref:NADPH:quinone reductase-like Zn-dependent oxidoreductase n=1 Tax=Streptosporangium lutulentum TaxID=1461250 RepID=A0ABT9QB07_9ACTN|nr:NAD(P)-dependent alcohol dehydrogenase [Streptosporangium lutulentum]MDP9843899.1 NADPH:quinone reductase-like Zn-dependent oxidoreductase [Streptosporangium lutulentum]